MGELSVQAEKYLHSIMKNTGETAKALGAQADDGMFSGFKSGLNDASKGTKGLIGSFKELQKQQKIQKEANIELTKAKKEEKRILSDLTKKRTDSANSINSLSATLHKELTSGSGVLSTNTEIVSNAIASLSGKVISQMDQYDDSIEAQKNLQEQTDLLNDVIKEHKGRNETAIEGLNALREATLDAAESGEDLSSIQTEYINSIGIINNALHKNGMSVDSLSKTFKDADGDFESVLNGMEQSVGDLTNRNKNLIGSQEALTDVSKHYSKEMQELVKATKAATAATQKNAEAATEGGGMLGNALGAFKKFNWVGALKVAAGAAVAFGTRMVNVMGVTQETGFELGGFDDIKELLDASFLMGVTPEEAQRFAAANRDVLTSITNTAMLTAGEGIRAIEDYGDVVKNTFGATGQAQLEMVSQGITTLSNIGIDAGDQANFNAFTQGIENMAKVSNKSAAELFSEFKDMADDPNFQGLVMSLGNNANVTTMLSESFLSLQTSVGMNADEFMKYRKQLAAERGRMGVDRVVQGAFAGQLAEELGMGADDAELLQQGKAFRESLTLEQRGEFDEKMVDLQKRLGTALTAAFQSGDVQKAQKLQILMQQAGIEEITSIQMREQAKVTTAVAEQQAKRREAAEKETEKALALAATGREIVKGMAASPLGPAALLSAGGDVMDEIGKDLEFGTLAEELGFPGIATALKHTSAGVDTLGAMAIAAAKNLGILAEVEEVVVEDPEITRKKARDAALEEYASGIVEKRDIRKSVQEEIINDFAKKLGVNNISELDEESRRAVLARVSGVMTPASQLEASKQKRETATVEAMAKNNKTNAEKSNLTAEETAALSKETLAVAREGNATRAVQTKVLQHIANNTTSTEESVLGASPPSSGRSMDNPIGQG